MARLNVATLVETETHLPSAPCIWESQDGAISEDSSRRVFDADLQSTLSFGVMSPTEPLTLDSNGFDFSFSDILDFPISYEEFTQPIRLHEKSNSAKAPEFARLVGETGFHAPVSLPSSEEAALRPIHDPFNDSREPLSSSNRPFLAQLLQIIMSLDSQNPEAASPKTNNTIVSQDATIFSSETPEEPSLAATFQQSEALVEILGRLNLTNEQMRAANTSQSEEAVAKQQTTSIRSFSEVCSLNLDQPVLLIMLACYSRIFDIFEHHLLQPSLSSAIVHTKSSHLAELPHFSVESFTLPPSLRPQLIMQSLCHYVEQLSDAIDLALLHEEPDVGPRRTGDSTMRNTIQRFVAETVRDRKKGLATKLKNHQNATEQHISRVSR